MDIVDEIRQFLAKELRIADAETLDPDLPLVQKGVLDSIELLQVVTFLEKQFTIEIDETEVLPANLRNLSSMAAFIERKRAAAQ
ncbi:MAG: acyl carrier protein [bacterium]|nr:acyl carrier protein [bacterium]